MSTAAPRSTEALPKSAKTLREGLAITDGPTLPRHHGRDKPPPAPRSRSLSRYPAPVLTLDVALQAQRYEKSGQRSDVRVYFNGGTLPGEKDRVYMEWLAEAIESPYRAGNEIPQETRDLSAELREFTTDSWIEFNELFTPDKAQRD